jgi:protein-tyrosine phosphatase
LIDLHTHILPGVDDGAENLAVAVAMAQMARDDGVTTIVATPHRNPWAYCAEPDQARQLLAGLQKACHEAGCDVELLLGGEAHIAPDLPNQLRQGVALTINDTRYLLIEWPVDLFPAYSDRVIFDLQVRGIMPIIAHAERYRVVQRNVRFLVPLIERGLVVQVTASSLLGEAGPVTQHVAETMLVENLAHVLASDSHSVTRRPPVLSAARARAAELVGAERARALVEAVPRAIVDNRALSLPVPSPSRGNKPFWAFWRSES